MPELPEVESTRRHLVADLEGRVIKTVEVRRPRMLRRQPRAADFADRLAERRVTGLRRHGKFLLIDLEGDIVWVVHLGMSGRVSLTVTGAEEERHTNVVVGFDDGHEFRLVDPRTFGFVAAFTPSELDVSPIGLLGPDALTELPQAADLSRRLAGRTASIKPLLLDQRIVAGMGNIYTDEALHRAAISPHRPAGTLDRGEVRRLRSAIKATLDAGLRHGGTSLDDLAYLLPDGRAGEFLSELRAYGREDQPCRRCGYPIVRDVIRQRSTFWCANCQH